MELFAPCGGYRDSYLWRRLGLKDSRRINLQLAINFVEYLAISARLSASFCSSSASTSQPWSETESRIAGNLAARGQGGSLQVVASRIWAGATVLVISVASGDAGAADFPRGAPYYTVPAPASGYSWTGPYLGGNLGYQWGDTTRNPTNPSGIAGGVQGGYNWQTGQFVFGAE